ncbi:ribulose-phosphate 3-epimerase [Candidatus Daviesbacteria bacterium]|nr:ribulose-phosphate 3-epimerase [Candidatus Daviesbacteria bacterium]MBI4038581.1 ribulose-phosphate 3-epimerase [Candidatus Daviesbacteria bacterium]
MSKMTNIQIIPAILATSKEQFQKDLSKIISVEALRNGWVHIDFADNKFVQNKTINPGIVQKFPINFRKEAHLMVSKPREWIDDLVKAGFERVIIHLEAGKVDEAINYAQSQRLKIGLAIKNETDIENLESHIDKIDTVLLMSIIPGFQGQPLIPNSLRRIKEVKNKSWRIRIGIDGAVRDDNIKDIVDSGVDFVIVGSYLLKGNIDKNLENLRFAMSK